MFTVIYWIWFLVPAVVLFVGLFSFLEKVSGKRKTDNSSDLFKQGTFLLGCNAITVLLDQFLLREALPKMLPEWIPYPLVLFLLFPFMMYFIGAIVGPTNKIQIKRPPHPTEKHRR